MKLLNYSRSGVIGRECLWHWSHIILWFVSTNRKNETRREQKMLKALHSVQWNKKYLSVYRTPCAAVDNFVKSNTYRAEIEKLWTL